MDKCIELFCKQNQNISLPCGNPKCKIKHTFKTKDVFRSEEYSFKCSSCGDTTIVDTSKVAKDITDQLKKLGVIAK